MMTPTHALAGALVGGVVARGVPEVTALAVVVGFVGGTLPDADLLGVHRKSTHYPVYSSVVAVLVVGIAVLVPTTVTVLLAVFSVSIALHCVMDAFGGGVGLRPWEGTSERGVYNHYAGRWVRPRGWIRYAGSPEDFLLATVCCLPLLALTTGRLQIALGVVLVVSGGFALVRRRLSGITERLFADAL